MDNQFTYINWIKSTDSLPLNGQRVLAFRPDTLAQVKEMVFYNFREDEVEYFLKEVTHWAPAVNRPNLNEINNHGI